jgi:endoglucanase
LLNALNFMLGVHPGENTASFASGVGAKSATVAYGFNRADWTYIPGGVVSGTALIRPDFPELKVFPYLWQQVEYVLGGGSSNYMFLVLAADQVLNQK